MHCDLWLLLNNSSTGGVWCNNWACDGLWILLSKKEIDWAIAMRGEEQRELNLTRLQSGIMLHLTWSHHCALGYSFIAESKSSLAYNTGCPHRSVSNSNLWGCRFDPFSQTLKPALSCKAIWPVASQRMYLISSSWMRQTFGLCLAALGDQAWHRVDPWLTIYNTPTTLMCKLVTWQA